jgi:hypothetical protein
MEASFLQRHPVFRDVIGVITFIVMVVLGTIFINTFIFRSFNVVGPSMETLINNLNALLANSGVDLDDAMHAARLHSSNTDSNSYLTIWYNSESENYVLVWVYVNNYDMVAVLDAEVEDVAETLNQAKKLFADFFRD